MRRMLRRVAGGGGSSSSSSSSSAGAGLMLPPQPPYSDIAQRAECAALASPDLEATVMFIGIDLADAKERQLDVTDALCKFLAMVHLWPFRGKGDALWARHVRAAELPINVQ